MCVCVSSGSAAGEAEGGGVGEDEGRDEAAGRGSGCPHQEGGSYPTMHLFHNAESVCNDLCVMQVESVRQQCNTQIHRLTEELAALQLVRTSHRKNTFNFILFYSNKCVCVLGVF